MSKVVMTRGKFDGINACADARGVIAAAAMDQRGSLQKAIGTARGEGGKATAEELSQFKVAVAKILTKYASAILLDPEYGLDALKVRATGSGVLLAYEKTGYDATVKGRLPDLLDEWSVLRLVEAGANAIKILLYYDPYDDEAVNRVKHAFIERVGGECAASDVPFFLENIYYDDTPGDERPRPGAAQARGGDPLHGRVLEPTLPRRRAEGGSPDRHALRGGHARLQRHGRLHAGRRDAAVPRVGQRRGQAVHLPERRRERRGIPRDARASDRGRHPLRRGALRRATWQEGVPVYGREGLGALEGWLEDKGVKNITAVNEILAKGAHPWWEVYGGKDNITVVDRVIS